MPTPSEQKALAFAAIVVLLGGAVRVVRAGALAPPSPTVAEQQALARQAYAASSAATDQRAAKSARVAGSATAARGRRPPRLSFKRGDAGGREVAGVRSVPSPSVASPFGYPPPSARIDSPAGPGAPVRGPAPLAGPVRPIDLDTANEAQIDLLPRVGPALARRIVANRDSLGPFGNLAALRRVKGIGPATLERMAPFVTFSRQARQ